MTMKYSYAWLLAAGCIVGAVTLTILPEALRFLGQWYLVLYGLGVICIIVLERFGR